MHKTVGEILHTMDVQEFAYWREYFSKVPFSFDADDIRIGLLTAAYINSHQGEEAKPVTVADLYRWRDVNVAPVEPLDPAEIERRQVAAWEAYAMQSQIIHAAKFNR